MVNCVEEYTNISEVPKPFMMTVVEKVSRPYVFRAEIHQTPSNAHIYVIDASGDIALQHVVSERINPSEDKDTIPIALAMLQEVIFKAFKGDWFSPEQFNAEID